MEWCSLFSWDPQGICILVLVMNFTLYFQLIPIVCGPFLTDLFSTRAEKAWFLKRGSLLIKKALLISCDGMYLSCTGKPGCPERGPVKRGIGL